MRLAASLIALSLCAGCATVDAQDRVDITDFDVLPDGRFVYTTDLTVPAGKRPEEVPIGRERWLNEWLVQNSMCPGGYEILDRTFVATHGSLTGQVYQATYTGACV
ncbi:hypothetical protein [Microbaculum marinum]|uniref:Lipoprotein n=1 Tax=Microbaculum marinum TaxID=1764581 RepID=A0AAW9RT44_9HYPH